MSRIRCLATVIGWLVVGLLNFFPATASAAEIIYMRAADCVHCAYFEANELPAYRASPTARRVPLRTVDIGSFRIGDMGVRQMLPADLRYIADDRMIALGGTPRFIVVSNRRVVLNTFGRSSFMRRVLPLAQRAR